MEWVGQALHKRRRLASQAANAMSPLRMARSASALDMLPSAWVVSGNGRHGSAAAFGRSGRFGKEGVTIGRRSPHAVSSKAQSPASIGLFIACHRVSGSEDDGLPFGEVGGVSLRGARQPVGITGLRIQAGPVGGGEAFRPGCALVGQGQSVIGAEIVEAGDPQTQHRNHDERP